MSRLRVHCVSTSADGFSAGPGQSLENPVGEGGRPIFDWQFATRAFQQQHSFPRGTSEPTTGVDNAMVESGFRNIGAWIMGRNMFGPVRGPWPNDDWKGWWGPDPVYHTPVFVLTHHARDPIVMEGGTTFHFVTEGIESALQQARAAAAGKDVRLGGGAATLRQYLQARLVDDLHLAVAPMLLGSGESLLRGLDLPALGYALHELTPGENALHLRFTHPA